MTAIRRCEVHGEWVDDGTTSICPDCVADRLLALSDQGLEVLSHTDREGHSTPPQAGATGDRAFDTALMWWAHATARRAGAEYFSGAEGGTVLVITWRDGWWVTVAVPERGTPGEEDDGGS